MNAIYEFLYDVISPVFGYVMLFFYSIVDGFSGNLGSYGVAIILFTIFARMIMLPTTIKQQKGMAKQQRLAPKLRRIQEKYAGNPQKIQEETQNLYAREGYNPMSAGCVPLLIQMPFIIGLFGVLYNPLRYAIGLDKETSELLVDAFSKMASETGLNIGKTEIYHPLYLIQNFDKFQDYFKAGIEGVSAEAMQKVASFVEKGRFVFFSLELGVQPDFKSKYAVIPVLSGLTSLASAYISQLQQKKANPGAKAPGSGCMMIFMPLMSVWFTTMFPCGIGVYWIVSNVVAMVQSVVLRKVFAPQKNVAKDMIKETIERRSREDSVKRINK
ncbi:MAG: YidC/Oxa1 family membrane protein insertase [Clostridia bacterium]|nr:YidC/Oxa1 family membrane protein insertase [Clostridia bacterium]